LPAYYGAIFQTRRKASHRFPEAADELPMVFFQQRTTLKLHQDSNDDLSMDCSVDGSSSILQPKAAPFPYKLCDDSEDSLKRFSSPTVVTSDSVRSEGGSGCKIMSQSYGGDPSPFLSGMMRTTPLPGSVQR
jgi:hypothetical protein